MQKIKSMVRQKNDDDHVNPPSSTAHQRSVSMSAADVRRPSAAAISPGWRDVRVMEEDEEDEDAGVHAMADNNGHRAA
jgi:hypothetical protein